MGELKINELRQYAHHTLNENFDILIFHDRVLEAGPIPLDILEQHIKRWVASQEPSQKLKKKPCQRNKNSNAEKNKSEVVQPTRISNGFSSLRSSQGHG